MAWNQPGEEKKRPVPRGSPDDSSLDDVLRRWQRRVQKLWRPGSGRGSAVLALVGIVLAVWLASGYYEIDANDRGVVQRFGRFVSVEQPGHGWHWPYPIESLTKVDVGMVAKGTDDKALLLTADQSLVDVAWSVQYRVIDPVRFLFQVRDQTKTLREASETALRELVAHHDLASLLEGDARGRVTAEAQERIQRTMDAYQAGIIITGVNMTDLQLPDAVLAAQRDDAKAEEERRRLTADAQGYANDILPKAQASAQRQLTDADVYAKQTLADAQGEAERFSQLAGAYAQAPEVTRSKIYIDTMEDILTRSRKIVVDVRAGSNVIYLPLDKLTDVTHPAPSGASSAAGTSSAGGSNNASAPANPVATATANPPANGVADRGDQDERGRERTER
jgi:membrane protease subunit HflK